MSAKLHSRISQITGRAQRGAPMVLDAAADRIKHGAKARVAKDERDLEKAIRVRRAGKMDRAVTAHSHKAFYGHLVEWGSLKKAARPFMTPAAEAELASGQLARELGELYR